MYCMLRFIFYELTCCMETSAVPDQLASLDLDLHRFLVSNCFLKSLYMGLEARKPFFCGLQKTKAQTSLRIRAV